MRVFTGSLVLAAAMAASGQSPVFPETQFSAGTLEKGGKVSHSFVFKNTGNKPLEVKAVTPT